MEKIKIPPCDILHPVLIEWCKPFGYGKFQKVVTDRDELEHLLSALALLNVRIVMTGNN